VINQTTICRSLWSSHDPRKISNLLPNVNKRFLPPFFTPALKLTVWKSIPLQKSEACRRKSLACQSCFHRHGVGGELRRFATPKRLTAAWRVTRVEGYEGPPIQALRPLAINSATGTRHLSVRLESLLEDFRGSYSCLVSSIGIEF